MGVQASTFEDIPFSDFVNLIFKQSVGFYLDEKT
jgi:hypothetical protein